MWFLLLKTLLLGASLQPCQATEERTRHVFGVVANSRGAPISNAHVDVLSLRRQPPDSPLAGSTFVEVLGVTTSDSKGGFSIEVQNENDSSELALEAIGNADGLGLRIEYPDDASLKNGITLTLPAEKRISCTFFRGNRIPVQGVNLKLVSVRSTRHGDDNTFPFTTVPERVTAWPNIAKSNVDGVVELAGVGDETELVVELDDIRFARRQN